MKNDFIKIYNDYKNDIFRLCYSYTKNITDAEDITQNVFLKYYRNMNRINNYNLKNWLIKVAINECKTLFLSSWYKKVKRLSQEDENKIQITHNDNDILENVFKLPKKERLIIHLYYYENYKIKEIAKILKLSESNIKVKLYRARKDLKDLLKEDL